MVLTSSWFAIVRNEFRVKQNQARLRFQLGIWKPYLNTSRHELKGTITEKCLRSLSQDWSMYINLSIIPYLCILAHKLPLEFSTMNTQVVVFFST